MVEPSGLAVILARFLPRVSPEQLVVGGFNVLLMAAAFLLLRKRMAFGTLWGSVFTTGFICLFDLCFRDFSGFGVGILWNILLGAVLIGLASGILFRSDASSGGTDILALIVRKYSRMNIDRALLGVSESAVKGSRRQKREQRCRGGRNDSSPSVCQSGCMPGQKQQDLQLSRKTSASPGQCRDVMAQISIDTLHCEGVILAVDIVDVRA